MKLLGLARADREVGVGDRFSSVWVMVDGQVLAQGGYPKPGMACYRASTDTDDTCILMLVGHTDGWTMLDAIATENGHQRFKVF